MVEFATVVAESGLYVRKEPGTKRPDDPLLLRGQKVKIMGEPIIRDLIWWPVETVKPPIIKGWAAGSKGKIEYLQFPQVAPLPKPRPPIETYSPLEPEPAHQAPDRPMPDWVANQKDHPLGGPFEIPISWIIGGLVGIAMLAMALGSMR